MDETDPYSHAQRMRSELALVINHLRQDMGKVDEPCFRMLYQTSAEVLEGLVKAFSDYERTSHGTEQ